MQAADVHPTYFVNEGDQIGYILDKLGYSPLWGEKGYVSQTVQLNPRILKKNGDFVWYGVTIRLPRKPLPLQVVTRTPAAQPPEKAAPPNQTDSVPLNSTAIDTKAFKEKILLSSTFTGTYVRIDATDTANGSTATLGSKLSPGLRLGLDHRFSQNWSYGARYRLQQIEFPNPRNKTIDQESKLLHEAGITGTYYGFKNGLSISPSLLFSERLFTAFKSQTAIALDKNLIPQANVAVGKKIFQSKTFFLSGNLGGGVLLPTKHDSYDIKTGYHFFAGLNSKHGITKKMRINTGLLGDYSRQDSTQVRYKNIGLVFLFGIEAAFDAHPID